MMMRKLVPLIQLSLTYVGESNLQDGQKNGQKDNGKQCVTAPEPCPVTPEVLRRGALNLLQEYAVHSLNMLHVGAINRILGG